MTPPLRIAVAAAGIGHVTRGIEVWADGLASALDGRNQNVVLCRGSGAAARDYERLIPCWRRDDPRVAAFARRLPKAFWRLGVKSEYGIEQTSFACGLVRFLRANEIDILHVQDPPVARVVQLARRLRLVKTRTILGHGTDEPDALIGQFDYLQHLTPWHLEQAKARGCWKPAWTAIPNFVEAERFRPGSSSLLREQLGIPANALVVMTAAAITTPIKRVDRLIDGFVEFRARHPDVPAWLVVAGGRSSDTDGLIESGQTRLGERVRFLTNYPPSRMPELYRIADIFALVSEREMMPVALLEAMATGLPCLVHRYPVMEWMTGPGGIAVDMAEPGVLAAALAGLLADPGRRATLGAAARAHCLANFSADAVVARILDYYQFVHESGPRGRPVP